MTLPLQVPRHGEASITTDRPLTGTARPNMVRIGVRQHTPDIAGARQRFALRAQAALEAGSRHQVVDAAGTPSL